MALPPAPKHNIRTCNDLSSLLDDLRLMGDGDGFLVKDGRVAIAPFSKRTEHTKARFIEKLVYKGPYRVIANQLEGRPITYIISGENFVFTLELSETNNRGKWFMTSDPYEEDVVQRAYACGGLGPDGMWAEHTQVRLYVTKPIESKDSKEQ